MTLSFAWPVRFHSARRWLAPVAGGLAVILATARSPACQTQTALQYGVNQCRRAVADPTVAMGKRQWMVQTANSQIRIANLSPTYQHVYHDSLDQAEQRLPRQTGFFAVQQATRAVDPKVVYDEDADRFAIVALDMPTPSRLADKMLIAYSNTKNPMPTTFPGGGGWTKKSIPAKLILNGQEVHFDYNGLAVTKAYLVYTGLLIDTNRVIRGQICRRVLKSSLSNQNITFFDRITTGGTGTEFAQPAHVHGSNPAPYSLLIAADPAGNSLRVTSIRDVDGVVTQRVVGVDPFAAPAANSGAPQAGTSDLLDVLDGRLMNAMYRADRDTLVTCHSIPVPITNGVKFVARWYELDLQGWPAMANATPTIRQWGNFDPGQNAGLAEIFTFFPAIAQDSLGNIGMIVARSAANEFPTYQITGRFESAAVGTLRAGSLPRTDALVAYQGGGLNGNVRRWGDYFGIGVLGYAFWATGSYARRDGHPTCLSASGTYWNTDVVSFQIAVAAGAWNYGAGFPGTTGIPGFSTAGKPKLGSNLTLDLGNSAGVATTAIVMFNNATQPPRVQPPFGGGIVVAEAGASLFTVPLNATGSTPVPFNIPSDPALQGTLVALQAFEADAGAVGGLSFTRGLSLRIGQH